MKLLMICTGNINRSPVAEWLCRDMVHEDIVVDSAGTSPKAGGKPMAKKIRIALNEHPNWKGLDIGLDFHRSKRVDGAMIATSNKVLCMAPAHYNSLVNTFGPVTKTKLVKLWEYQPLSLKEFADPAWTQGVEVARVVLKQIEESLKNFLKKEIL